MPKIRRPLRQPNKHAACLMPHAACPMPHAPCPRCRAANATAAKCDLQPIIVRASEGSSCPSLSLASSLSLCESKKQNFRKFAIEWLQQRQQQLRRGGSGGVFASAEHKNVYAFFLVTDRTQGFSYSAAPSPTTTTTTTLRKLHAHKN